MVKDHRSKVVGLEESIRAGKIVFGTSSQGNADDDVGSDDALPRYRSVRLLGKCEFCGMPLPLPGPLRAIPCHHCQETNSFSEAFWSGLIDALDDHPNIEEWSDNVEVKADESLPPEAMTSSAFDVPDWIRAGAATARSIIGGQQEGQAGGLAGPEVDEQTARPVAMACPKCGAGLEITVENPRNSTCEYCKTDIYLPDALWLKLHPIKKATRWYVEYWGLSRKARSQQQRRLPIDKCDHELNQAIEARVAELRSEPARKQAQRTGANKKTSPALQFLVFLAVVTSLVLGFLFLLGGLD